MNTSKPSSRVPNMEREFSKSFTDLTLYDRSTYKTLISKFCSDVDSVLSRRILNSLSYSEDDSHVIGICDVNPNSYSDWKSYYLDAQLAALVKKNPTLVTTINPKLEAMKTFIACELKCARTNDFFLSKPENSDFAFGTFLGSVREKIVKILGPAPSVEDLSFEFGPGASYSVKRNTTSLDKLGGTLDVTPNCLKLANIYLQTCPGWRANSEFISGPPSPPHFNVVSGDRLAFVPKTAKTDRPIAIGPLLNGLIQKGLGNAIRRRLKPVLDLAKTQDQHRLLAREGSIHGDLSTMDLKSASDTISFEVVRNLIPHDWFELLEASRSEWYEIDGRVYPYHKFSAMGNGYTFELETLIFYAIVSTVVEAYGIKSTVSVYGDDIIIPSACYHSCEAMLVKMGFDVNSDKSFHYGPFRESCGGDFFQGIDVRPFFLKDGLCHRTLFLLHNYLVRSGYQFLFPQAYRFIRQLLGKRIVSFFRTSNSMDDGALLDFSAPTTSYNRIVSRESGKSSNRLKAAYGVAYLLYRCQFIGHESSSEVDWRSFKLMRYRITHRLYRHVHI